MFYHAVSVQYRYGKDGGLYIPKSGQAAYLENLLYVTYFFVL